MTGAAQDDDFERIAQNFERELEARERTGPPEVEAAARLSLAEMAAQARNKLGYIIVWAYAGFIAAAMLYFGYLAIICQQNVTDAIMELGKVMIFPVITLVLGHFYGQKSA